MKLKRKSVKIDKVVFTKKTVNDKKEGLIQYLKRRKLKLIIVVNKKMLKKKITIKFLNEIEIEDHIEEKVGEKLIKMFLLKIKILATIKIKKD